MTKRILLVSTFFPPLNSIASLRPYSWAKYWTELGYSVTVLTTLKNIEVTSLNLPHLGYHLLEVPFPKFLQRLKSNHHSTQTVQSPGWKIKILNYLRFKKGILHSCRMPDWSDLWVRPALQAVAHGSWDLVVSTAGPYTTHIIAQNLKRKGQALRWVADYRDTWSDNYIYPGIFPINIWERFLEKKLLRYADAITTVSEPFAREIGSKHGIEKTYTVENGFDLCDLQMLPLEPIYSDGIYRIVHTGSIYLGKRDPSPLFQAVAEIGQEPAYLELLNRLEVIFVGPNQANLQELVNRFEVNKWVKMQGFVKHEDSLRMQRDAHALLFLPWTDPSVDGVMTGKLFEYLCSGTPIIAVGANQLEASQQLIIDTQCGSILTTVSAIKQFLIQELKQMQKKQTALAPEVKSRYDRKNLAKKLLEIANI